MQARYQGAITEVNATTRKETETEIETTPPLFLCLYLISLSEPVSVSSLCLEKGV